MDLPPGHLHGLSAPVGIDPSGVTGPTRGAAPGPRWRRSSRGLYVPSEVEATPLQRTVEVGVLVPTYGAVTGWAALGWLGGRWWDGGAPVDGSPPPIPVALTRSSIRAQPGAALCRERLDPREWSVVDGIQTTSAVRSVCFAMRYAASLAAAVVVLDMAAYDDLVSVADVAAWMAAHPSYTGIGRGRDASALGSENSWSPMETRSRMVWVVDAGLPAPLANRPVFDLSGRHLLTPDLLDPVAGVAAEYDGRTHDDPARRRADRTRQETYRRLGLECVVVMQGDLSEPAVLVDRLRAAYSRARGVDLTRAWTTEQPHWWVDTSTVELRRTLDEESRRAWLRYRTG